MSTDIDDVMSDDILMTAWGLIANARDWLLADQGDRQASEWRDAAIRWRDEQFHPWLEATRVVEADA